MYQLVWDAVVVMVDFYVIIDIDLSLLPLGELVTLRRQRFESRLIQGFVEFFATALQLLKGTLVKFNKDFFDSLVQFSQGEEDAVP